MTEFELWIKACEEFGTRIIMLEGAGDGTALYMAYNIGEPHLGNRWNTYRKDITYQVFINGKREFVTLDYRLALTFWEKKT